MDKGIGFVNPTESKSAAPRAGDPTHQSLDDFVRWAAVQLEVEASGENSDQVTLQIPLDARDRFDGQESVSLRSSDGVNQPLVDWIVEQLGELEPAAATRPTQQPNAVNAISPALFAAYEVEEGQIHLSGCGLEDRPFLRLTFHSGQDSDDPGVQHVYVSADGSSVQIELVNELGLDDIEPLLEAAPKIDDSEIAAMVTAGRRMAAQQKNQRDPSASAGEHLAVAVIWAKYVQGRLQFTIGDQSVHLPFEGWAKTLQPQPYVCQLTGVETFHLAATDDRRIAAAEQLAKCECSGRRVLEQELVVCHVTGKRVLPEFADTCSVTGLPTLSEEMRKCPTCCQAVSRVVLMDRGCKGCSQPARVPSDDPRLVWILEEHPGLAQWKNWRLAETETAYIVQAASLFRRLLIVVDRATLQIEHMAERGRFSRQWDPIPADEWQRYLR